MKKILAVVLSALLFSNGLYARQDISAAQKGKEKRESLIIRGLGSVAAGGIIGLGMKGILKEGASLKSKLIGGACLAAGTALLVFLNIFDAQAMTQPLDADAKYNLVKKYPGLLLDREKFSDGDFEEVYLGRETEMDAYMNNMKIFLEAARAKKCAAVDLNAVKTNTYKKFNVRVTPEILEDKEFAFQMSVLGAGPEFFEAFAREYNSAKAQGRAEISTRPLKEYLKEINKN